MSLRERYEITMFFVGALWNWGISLLLLTLALFNKQLLSIAFNKIPESMLWFYIFLAVVFIFGLGYYWISKDVKRNRDIIKMGIIGKIVIFTLFLVYAINGEIKMLGLAAGAVDLIFSLLFADVLFRWGLRPRQS